MEEIEKQQNTDDELKLLLARALAGGTEEEEEDETSFDWVGSFQKLLNRWKFIAAMTCFFTVLGVGIALLSPKQYTVSVTLAPEIQGRNATSSLSGLASMFGMGGISLGSTNDALNISLFPEISHSTPFITGLFDVKVTPYVSAEKIAEGAKPASPLTLYEFMTKDSWLSSLLKSVLPSTAELPEDTLLNSFTPEQFAVIRALRLGVNADVDNKTGLTTISVTMKDPQIATQLADTVCQRLQAYIIEYRTQKAKDDLNYYTRLCEGAKEKMIETQAAYAVSVDYDRSVILQSVNSEKQRLQSEAQFAQQLYQQMETQKEAAREKYQELKPVFAVIQPATFPEKPSSTSRKLVVVVWTFLGACIASLWVMFGKDYWAQFKEMLLKKDSNGSIEA